jgi:hypothetical protein
VRILHLSQPAPEEITQGFIPSKPAGRELKRLRW